MISDAMQTQPSITTGSLGTSAGGSLLKTIRMICISGALYIGGTVSSGASADFIFEPIPQTGSGYEISNSGKSNGSALMELRRLSGMTWDQLATLFGVARRSVHFWANGKSLNSANEEKLHRVLSTIRELDRGTAQANRQVLFTPQAGGGILFDLLRQGRYSDVVSYAADDTPRRGRPKLAPLSEKFRNSRLPIKASDLAVAEHKPIHRDIGKQRKVTAVRIKRTEQGDEV